MQSKSRYFKLGIFILFTFAVTIVFLIILNRGSLFTKTVKVESYFDESVQGLDVGSAVKHRGVKIGFVEEITFVRNEYNISPSEEQFFTYGRYVVVKMNIPNAFKWMSGDTLEQTLERMVHDGLRVRLASQGLTGTAYVEVDYMDVSSNKPFELKWKPKYYYIPSAPSTITKLQQSMNKFLEKVEAADLNGIAKNIDKLIVTLTATIQGARIPEVSTEVIGLLAEVRKTNSELKSLLASPELKRSPKKLEDTLTALQTTVKRMDTVLMSNQGEVSQALENLRSATEDLKETSSNAKKYPSFFLFGEAPAKSKK